MEVQFILETLEKAGHEAYVVGGCVRDLLLKKEPKDWDVATNAKPEEIQGLFPKSFYTNQFGTVTVLSGIEEVEVTTYRTDGNYSDQRHPDEVKFTTSLGEDLARRDFTVNAIALDEDKIVDPFDGQKDLEAKLIRAVGEATERFGEDALRLMRAVRLATQLGFEIEKKTLEVIKEQAEDIRAVSQERIRDELVKIVMSEAPEKGFNILEKTGLLKRVMPELAEGVGVDQNKHHTFTVFEHSVKSLQYAADFGYSLEIRLAALLHDIGKPRTRRLPASAKATAGKGAKPDYTFYAHDVVSARMTEGLMRRLKFSSELTNRVAHLVRHHMFYYDVGKVTEAGARRLLRRVGKEHFDDLIKLRIAERKGSGVPKAEPYRLRHLQFMIEKAVQQPITVGQLAIGGNDLIEKLGLKPSPQIGGILGALLAEVLEDPKKNKREWLLKRADELKDIDPEELKALGVQAALDEERKREDDIRRKYHV